MINKKLKDKIIELANKDQALRREIFSTEYTPTEEDWDKLRKVDAETSDFMKETVKEFGLPTISMVGKSAENFAWMLVQHSPDLKFRKEYLQLLKKANPKDIQLAHIAYLEDRINTIEKKPQIYGTQVVIDRDTGKPTVCELEDPTNVNKRRKEMEMEPLEEYLKSFE